MTRINTAEIRLAVGSLILVPLFLVACAPLFPPYVDADSESEKVEEEGDKNGDKLVACPSWERRTERSTTKLICALPGGDICTPDQTVCLKIPPRALNQDTEITLTIAGPEFDVTDKEQLYPGAKLEPDGLTFQVPVKATVRINGADNLENVSLLRAESADQYEELDAIGRNSGTGEVTGELDTFSWLYPFLVNPVPPAAAQPSIRVQGTPGGPGGPIFGVVGNGATGSVGLRVTQTTAGLVWTDGTNAADTLVLQVNYPAAVAGQIAHATLTMIDPGQYTTSGPNARQRWLFHVFNRIFQHMVTGLHTSGADGIAIYPIRANDINWSQLPAGYPSGQVSAFIQYFDENAVLIGTSTLVLSVARP